MSGEIDRVDAEVLAEMLQVPVNFIPEDADYLTGEVWKVVFGFSEPMPESVEVRWDLLIKAVNGIIEGFGGLA